MTTADFLSRLRALGVNIWTDNGSLHCNAPKGVLSQELRDELVSRKEEIITFVRESANATRNPEPPIRRIARDGTIPLSFSQERLWLLDQLEPGNPAYHISATLRIEGPLDVPVLEQSLNEIVQRHESLRTNFRTVDGQPVQLIFNISRGSETDPSKYLTLRIVDFPDLPPAKRETAAMLRAAGECQRPFDLSLDLMLRASLFRLGDAEHLLTLTMHHIASDGWSMAILFRELSVLYDAFRQGKPSPLPPLAIQYADFACWQRNWLQGRELESQFAYWKQQLKNIPSLELPRDHPRPSAQTYRGERLALTLPAGLTASLKALSQSEGATLFMTLLSAFQTLLSRYAGQEDIAIGSPIANRNRTQIEGLIGFFLNTLVLRTDLSGGCTFRELMRRVRETTLEAYGHQELPFEKLLEKLRPGRDLGRTPLFQVFFNMINVEEISLKLTGLQVRPVPAATIHSKFDLTLYAREQNEEIRFNLVYNCDLFKRDRMAEMLRQYERLLLQAADNPDRTLPSFSLITPEAERRLPDPTEPLCSDWSGAVHSRCSDHARRDGDRLAITDPHDRWSYRELEIRSNQLAHFLLEGGIQREEVVAIYGHRSAALVWAIIGVLKAGAAFLILDPAYPAGRLSDHVQAAKPRGLIRIDAAGPIPEELERTIRSTIRCSVALPRLAEFSADDEPWSYSTDDPDIRIAPDDLAYIAFTSGSTGKPKGALGRHQSLSHFLPWQEAEFGLGPGDRFSMLSGLSHDPLQRDVLTALWVGATICIPDPDIIGAPGQLANWMIRQRITFAHLTPSMSRILSGTADPGCQLTSLRYAFFVGDKLTWSDVVELQRLAPSVVCINSYGAAETQRAVSYHEVRQPPGEPPPNGIFPVGKGSPNVQLLVLKNGAEMCGIGEIGEIFMRSPHLSGGYLDDELLTRERFPANPFTRQIDDRLYKMGDVGRYLPDGTVEILGRSDRQVKIRGFRIELGEIETVLSAHPDIRECRVLLRMDDTGEERLAACVTLQPGKTFSRRKLDGYLKTKLPDPMIPPAIICLDALPLTPNGKTDDQALAALDGEVNETEQTFVAPRTPVEKTLAAIWGKVLRRERIGIHDNFFELGGHSLLATRVLYRVREALHLEVRLRTLFEAPTIAEFAVSIVQSLIDEDTAHALKELESLSDDEAARALLKKTTQDNRP